MNITGIEQGHGPLSQVANALSSSSKPATAVQRPEDKDQDSRGQLEAGAAQGPGITVEISRAAQALSNSQFSSQQGSQQQFSSSLVDGQ
ncbi:MAG: hypothetical protein MRJ96_14140 [Nitrospirales bacterium]|nr:hypothetical protein [Nitrospira sp.]MDR4502585.1 hypothetical protein [Nitrospirales bacterium]